MDIFVNSNTSRSIAIRVSHSDRVATIKKKVSKETGIPVHEQRLYFRGKELLDTLTVSETNINNGATLHLTRDEAVKTAKEPFPYIEDWDKDEYILNPQAHFGKIEALSDTVVKSSEFFRCRGEFNLEDDQFDPVRGFSSPNCDPSLWEYFREFRGILLPAQDTNAGAERSLGSLAKSYLIVCQVLDSLDLMTQKDFCKSSYRILVQHTSGDIAELVRLESREIRDLRDNISDSIIEIYKSDSGEMIKSILQLLRNSLELFMHRVHLIPLKTSLSWTDVCIVCRLLATLLDIGLVAYMGSHASRFDMNYLNQDTWKLRVNCDSCRFGFIFCLRRLSCLDEFLDRKRVWVFQPWDRFKIDSGLPYNDSQALSVLAYMEDFADVWGPVWSIPAFPDFPDHIQQYNVSKGLIRRSKQVNMATIDQALCCHWYNWSSSSHLPAIVPKDELISVHDRLLIGTILRENQACMYTLDDYEKRYSHSMTPLGTSPSRWCLDTRSAGFNASQYIGISVTGTQKKHPQTSVKQHIWEKWNNSPQKANPRMLNQFLGVEISHCTGNARRIRIRDFFFIKPIQAHLEDLYPDWDKTDYGSALLRALRRDEHNDIQTLWREQYQNRYRIAVLVCSILSVLDKTSVVEGQFVAAFLNDGKEFSMPLSLRSNDWAGFLQDSHLTAVYTIINEKCLECHALGHYTSICSSTVESVSCFTVFETQIALLSAQGLNQKIWMDRGGYLKKLSERDDSILFFTWEPGRLLELVRSFATRFSSEDGQEARSYEVRDQYELGARKSRICLRASTPSYGGLQTKRVHRIQELLASGVLDETDGNSESLPEDREVPVHIKTLNGIYKSINVSLTSTCNELKHKTEIAQSSMLVRADGRWIPGESILRNYGITEGSTIIELVSLWGRK